MKQASELRSTLSAMDLDPGYFCKFVKDQFVRKTIREQGLKTILDVGCDTAYMAGMLNYDKYEFSYMGVDKQFAINPSYLREGQNFCKTDDTVSYLLGLNEGIFDCILLLDVIEHFSSPEEGWQVLDICARKLKKGGFLFVSTPNRLGKDVNWPKYHQYEYSIEELYAFSYEKINDFTLYSHFGWSMSDEMFNQFHVDESGVLPKEVERVLCAIEFPKESRDVMFVWRKNE